MKKKIAWGQKTKRLFQEKYVYGSLEWKDRKQKNEVYKASSVLRFELFWSHIKCLIIV